ncbi:MAG TPA: TetR/AcrR family transcriptional regulator [Gammaproteobacteria bacterium]|jgi:AcrR family transcriptional regulator
MLLEGRQATPEAHFAEEGLDTTIRRFQMRRRILDVAKHRFARAGYDQVSLEDVAYGVDLDWEEFRKHFRDKAELLTAILDDGWKDLLPRLSDAASASSSAHSAILGVFALLSSALHKDEDLMRLFLLEGRRPELRHGELGLSDGYRRFLQLCRDLVLRGQRDGSFRARHHPQVAASMLVGAFEGMLRDRLLAAQEHRDTAYAGPYLMSAFDALVSALKH